MDSLILTVLYILLGYVIIVIISRCMGGQSGEGGDGGGADTPDNPSGGGGKGDGKRDGNLLKNNCGQDQLQNWTVMSNGGEGWKVESTPIGCDSLPTVDTEGNPVRDFGDHASCFAASSALCMKEQLVDLISCGFTREYLDKKHPPIEISEWYACRADCGGTYLLNVTLLDENKKNITNYHVEASLSGSKGKEWHKASHTFSQYGTGIRYVSFSHAGSSSTPYGQYGSKMSGGTVRVLE